MAFLGNRVYLYCVRIVRCAVLEIQLSQYITMLALHSDLPTVQFITFMKKQCSHGHISDVQGKSIQNHKFFFSSSIWLCCLQNRKKFHLLFRTRKVCVLEGNALPKVRVLMSLGRCALIRTTPSWFTVHNPVLPIKRTTANMSSVMLFNTTNLLYMFTVTNISGTLIFERSQKMTIHRTPSFGQASRLCKTRWLNTVVPSCN